MLELEAEELVEVEVFDVVEVATVVAFEVLVVDFDRVVAVTEPGAVVTELVEAAVEAR